MNLKEFDEIAFEQQIEKIRVLSANQLMFVFYNGITVQKEWHCKPRSESWSEEARQKARERNLTRLEGGSIP